MFLALSEHNWFVWSDRGRHRLAGLWWGEAEICGWVHPHTVSGSLQLQLVQLHPITSISRRLQNRQKFGCQVRIQIHHAFGFLTPLEMYFDFFNNCKRIKDKFRKISTITKDLALIRLRKTFVKTEFCALFPVPQLVLARLWSSSLPWYISGCLLQAVAASWST